jgi:diguanylate cyclase (GGDEF)-like protein
MSLASILIIGAIILAGGCVSLLLVRLENPRLLGLGWLGGALGAGGTGALLLLLDVGEHPLLSVLLADLLVLASFVLLNLAVMEVVAIPGLPRLSLLLLAVQTVADLFHLYGPGSAHFRVTVIGLLVAAQTAQTIFLLLRRSAPAVRSPARCISVILIGFIGWNFLRSVAIASGVMKNRTIAGQPLSVQVQMWTDILYLVVALGLAFGFFWLTTARLTAAVEDLADTDPLTNALNRRAFYRSLAEEFHRVQRLSTSFALVLVDLDHFKQINDRYGHIAGDKVLCTAVHNMKNATRGIDLIGRWGGEEFAVLLPQANFDTAQIVAERIRANIHRPTPAADASKLIPFTASLGIAINQPGDTAEDIFRRADEALYRAKAAGRNCIRSAPPESPSPRRESKPSVMIRLEPSFPTDLER